MPLSKTGAELLFEVFSRRYERSATLVTSNLPFNEWTEAFGSERLTGALLDRLTHHVHILEMNGESYRLKDSKRRAPEATFLATPVYGADLQGRLPLRPKRAPPSGSQAYAPAAPANPLNQSLRHTGDLSTFPPLQWPSFTPPLTRIKAQGVCDSLLCGRHKAVRQSFQEGDDLVFLLIAKAEIPELLSVHGPRILRLRPALHFFPRIASFACG